MPMITFLITELGSEIILGRETLENYGYPKMADLLKTMASSQAKTTENMQRATTWSVPPPAEMDSDGIASDTEEHKEFLDYALAIPD